MKIPTNKELQELAVRALGEGATVELRQNQYGWWGDATEKDKRGECLRISVHFQYWTEAKIALAAALEALAEVRK